MFQVQRYAVGCIDHGGIQHSIDRDSPVGRSRSVTGEDDVCPAVAQRSVERVIPVDRLDEQGAAIRFLQGSGDILEDAGKRYFRSAGKVELGTGRHRDGAGKDLRICNAAQRDAAVPGNIPVKPQEAVLAASAYRQHCIGARGSQFHGV